MLIIISFILVLTNSCATSHKFDNSNCVFYMKFVDDSCNAFTFSECSWQWSGTKTSSDWNTCTKQCCPFGQSFAQTSDGIDQCQKDITKTMNILGIVLGSIIGSVVVTFLVACLVVVICKTCCQKGLKIHPVDENQRPIIISSEELKRWQKVVISKSPLKYITCSVCLEDGCFFELECSHIYHRKCILLCLKNKKECILCRRKQLQNVRVYCRKCFKFYYQSPLKNFSNSEVKSEEICERCKNQGSNQ